MRSRRPPRAGGVAARREVTRSAAGGSTFMPDEILPRRYMMTAATAALMGAKAGFAKDPSLMNHVVLLGDSVFDNAAYVSGGPDVVTQLRGRLPSGWSATLAAVDGAVTASVPR